VTPKSKLITSLQLGVPVRELSCVEAKRGLLLVTFRKNRSTGAAKAQAYGDSGLMGSQCHPLERGCSFFE